MTKIAVSCLARVKQLNQCLPLGYLVMHGMTSHISCQNTNRLRPCKFILPTRQEPLTTYIITAILNMLVKQSEGNMPINLETDKYRSILIREIAKQRPQAKHIDVFWPEEETIVASVDGVLYAMEIGSDDDGFLFKRVKCINFDKPNFDLYSFYLNDPIKFDYPEDWQ